MNFLPEVVGGGCGRLGGGYGGDLFQSVAVGGSFVGYPWIIRTVDGFLVGLGWGFGGWVVCWVVYCASAVKLEVCY